MKFFFFLLTFFLFACSPEKGTLRNSRYHYTVNQLQADKGPPEKTTENIINTKYEMYHYGNDVYQINGNKVITKFRNPLEYEKNIQYWRHLLKGIYYKIEIDKKSKSHSPNNILSCKIKGLTIYFNNIGSVLRIGESMGVKGEK